MAWKIQVRWEKDITRRYVFEYFGRKIILFNQMLRYEFGIIFMRNGYIAKHFKIISYAIEWKIWIYEKY